MRVEQLTANLEAVRIGMRLINAPMTDRSTRTRVCWKAKHCLRWIGTFFIQITWP